MGLPELAGWRTCALPSFRDYAVYARKWRIGGCCDERVLGLAGRSIVMPRIQSDLTVTAGEFRRLTFTSDPLADTQGNFGFYFAPATGAGLSFTNYGRVEFITDAPDADLHLLYTESSVSGFSGVVWENQGALVVQSTQGGAHGYSGNGSQLFRNSGSLIADGKLFAQGYATYGVGNVLLVDNRGDILVHGAGSASGVLLNNHNKVQNSGLIRATSDQASDGFDRYAYGVVMRAGGELTNTGRIAAINTGAARESVGVFVGGGPFQLTNSGEISGAEAVYASTLTESVVTNTGRMLGDVILGDGGDRLTNSGVITGQIDLRGGADLYAGSAATTGVRVAGGSGSDTLSGGAMADSLAGGGDGDSVFGGQGDDTVSGGTGVDYLRGDDGADSISGGLNFDDINGNAGADTASGGDGDDWVVGGKDGDQLGGEAGADIVYGNLGADTCDGGDGDDLVRGGQDDDVLWGGSGSDWLSGDRGSDTVTGGSGADIFHTFGDAGVDRITDFNVGEGDRVLFDPGTTYTLRDAGGDTIVEMAGGGQLILVGVRVASLPADWASGAAGPSLEPPPLPKPVVVVTGRDFGDDYLLGGAGLDLISGLGGDDSLKGGEEADTLDGGAGNDTLMGDGGADVLRGGDGRDLLDMRFSNAAAVGGAGDDTFFLRATAPGEPVRLTLIEGGAGYDTVQLLSWQPGQRLVIDGGSELDQVMGGSLGETTALDVYLDQDPGGAGLIGRSLEIVSIPTGRIFGGGGDDTLSLYAGLIEGRGGNDQISSSDSRGGSSTLDGGEGDDAIYSGKGSDLMIGGAGRDTLSGAGGADTLTGGAGADQFLAWSTPGLARVTDFDVAEGDRVNVANGAAFTSRQVGTDTVVTVGGEDRMVLVGVTLSTLPDGWIFSS